MLAGTITLIYRADRGRVRQALAQTQAAYLKEVISSQHVFLEDDQSLEVLLVQGPAERLQQLCDALRKVRGVQQIKLVTTTALLPPAARARRPSDAPRKRRMSDTADPHGARAHARARPARGSRPCRPCPPRRADLPAGVAADDVLWEETIAAGGYASTRLARGARLRLIDLHGDACVSMLVFNAEQPVERLNVADTVKVQWNAYLGAGKLLLSDMGRVLMSILEDDAGTHDTFCGASNDATNARKYGDGANYGAHPNARDRFAARRSPSTASAARTCIPASTCSRACAIDDGRRDDARRSARSRPAAA